ncbi:AMP-binding protein [Nocardia carnea]|uniref:AMP-binding protein n=1 Tax=Nocardia carnea TaxID=37328 RepID=A0ABW7TJ91_9NOCA|nr:AMP-binding protein [Nocardia carnea]
MEPDEYVAAVRDWLTVPAADTGVYFADEGSGWDYRSYADLAELSWAVAELMREHGMRAGAGVCVIMPTGFPCAAAFYAVWACGGVFTPVAPPMYGDFDEYVAHIGSIIRQAAPLLVLTSNEFRDLARRAHAAAGRTDEPVVVDPVTLPAAPQQRRFAEPDECALLQFTSGSTGTPRGVRVSWRNLANNIAMISALVDWRPGEAMVSWLPLYHDMGLVGAFLTTVTNQGDLYLMRPDQFVRDPVRWLRAMTRAQHCPSPSFALGYVAHRVRAAEIADLDLSGWRTLAVGSEPVEVADLQSFAELTAPQGFSMRAYTLAYGLAEATLMVSSSARDRPITSLRLDTAALRFGQPVTVLAAEELADGHTVTGSGWVNGLGFSTPESTVRVVDADGNLLPDGTLGEMVVAGGSVALGYSEPAGPESSTRIQDGVLYTGDAGFLRDGEVFVLGRMGSSLKVRGRPVFMEDIESRVAQETGLTKGKLAAVALPESGGHGIALFAESAPGEWIERARGIIAGQLGPAHTVTVVTGPRGIIQRTSSGKPRRRHMWERFREGALDGAMVHETPGTTGYSVPPIDTVSSRSPTGAALPADSALPGDRVIRLLDAALERVAVPAGAAVLFEGSLAEGFGNAGSDVDFLVVAAGSEEMPTLPTVLFVAGRRVEIRTRSAGQLRRQLTTVADSADPAVLDEDVLNRCQRFLRATLVRPGSAVDLPELYSVLTHDEFAQRIAEWWTARAREALRYAVAWSALEAGAEAADWGADGLRQAVKAWAARQGETYLETKWLPEQLNRLGAVGAAVARKYSEPLSRDETREGGPHAEEIRAGLERSVEFAAELGVDGVSADPGRVLFARIPGVTTWQIGDRVHVLRGDGSVFVLGADAARVWRSVVFRRPVAAIAAGGAGRGEYLAEFVRLGFVGLDWQGAGRITAALAMCRPVQPYTPPPAPVLPVLGVNGATLEPGRPVALSALPAQRFVACGMGLVWSNIVLENAREDLTGAVKDGQWEVAEIAAHRLLAMAVRVLLSAFGVHPLPADTAPLPTLARVLPASAARRADLLAALGAARRVRFGDPSGDTTAALRILEDFVALVRTVAGEQGFPASFDSRDQWRRTLAIGYDWLRLAGYLDAELPLDEARDLLTSGGRQPHIREGEPQ